MVITTLRGRYYRGKNKGSAKFNEIEAPAEVTLLLSSNRAGGWGGAGSQANPALHALPGTTEKQLLLRWQELGGQLSVSTRHHGRLEKRAVSSFFTKTVSFQEKQTGQARESTRGGGLCQVSGQAVLAGRREASAGLPPPLPKLGRRARVPGSWLLQPGSPLTTQWQDRRCWAPRHW